MTEENTRGGRWLRDYIDSIPDMIANQDRQIAEAVASHQAGQRCGRCNQPLGALLVNLGKTIHYDCS